MNIADGMFRTALISCGKKFAGSRLLQLRIWLCFAQDSTVFINGLIEFFFSRSSSSGKEMAGIRFLPLPSPHHTVSFLISQFTFKVGNVQCSVLFFLTKKNVDTAKSFEHITIKDKNQSSQLDWCKITVTIANACMYSYRITTQHQYAGSKSQCERVYVFHYDCAMYISVALLRKWHLNETLNNSMLEMRAILYATLNLYSASVTIV